MKLIAGLGNPGRAYEGTPHNVGYDVVEILRERHGGSFSDDREFKGRVAKVSVGRVPVLLVQPTTFMNLSGECIAPLAHYYRVEPKDVTVVVDDAELPPGRMRIRADGGDGGHNGLASVIQHLGTQGFPRIRVGIGRGEFAHRDLAKHVLGRMSPEERSIVDRVLPVAADAATAIVLRSVGEAMNQYNGFTVEAKDETPAPDGADRPSQTKETHHV